MNANISGNRNTRFLYAGIVIALLISILAPFLASSDPDGLESAAEGVLGEERMSALEELAPVFESPMPDYSIEGHGKAGEAGAIVIGTLIMLGIGLALGKVMKKK